MLVVKNPLANAGDVRIMGSIPGLGRMLVLNHFERIIMYLTGVSNIRDVIPYPRTVGNAEY